MARLARVEVFAPDEIAVVHVMNRVVRRCFLLGEDSVTGKNYDHRKVWVDEQLQRLAANMGIDLIAFSILSNHFHIVLRSRPDVVGTWDDTEVARRWLLLCPLRKSVEGAAVAASEFDLNSIRNDGDKLKRIRSRLSDISWWMRLLCQRIATRANFEDGEVGKFFQARYRAVRLLDESAVLACAAYVDLNPIHAAMAETLETSDFTSVQRRIESLAQPADSATDQTQALISNDSLAESSVVKSETQRIERRSDRFLSPVMIEELHDPLGAQPSILLSRCSDKGFLPMSATEYIDLLDWTARQTVPGKRGCTPERVPPILERLSISGEIWCHLVKRFGKLFYVVAGQPQTIEGARSRQRHHRYRVPRETKEIMSANR